MTIQILAPEVAAKIAAGEVVERPANVVKELLENSLDAGATEIRVEAREGGRRLLRVIDNGHGIPAAELPLAFERHATSKLSTVDDLNHIATFGFRGEALYSIGAVSQVTLTSRHASQPFGATVRNAGGVLQPPTRAGAPVGTTVSVEHIFFNVPARQKFLRAAATESGQIAAIIQHYALAYPERRFSFVNDGRLIFQSTGSGDLLDVLIMIYGRENAQQMVSLTSAARRNTATLDTPALDNLALDVDFGNRSPAQPESSGGEEGVRVSGYVSLPSLTRANRSAIDLFVNRRYVEDRSLTHAVVQAYHTLLPVGRYPVAVVFVEIDPAQVDVNVHPQKTQVRFVEERRVFAAVQKAVRRTLISVAPIPDVGIDETGRLMRPEGESSALPAGWATRRDVILGAGAQPHLDLVVPPAPPTQHLPSFQPDVEQSPASEAAAHSSQQPRAATPLVGSTPKLPPLRVVGQVGAMYVIAEGPEGLFLIDQHAAHERILYEQYMLQRASGASGVARQHLLEPLTLHVGARLTGQVAAHLDALQHIGFDIEAFGGDAFLVRAVPAVLAGEDPQRVLEEIVATLGDRRNLVGEGVEAQLVKMVCKRAAIKAGQLLSDIEMQELVRQLEQCQSPRTCPHGRPTMIQLSANELEKAFGRI